MADVGFPVAVVTTLVFAAAGGVWALWDRMGSVRKECLDAVSDLRTECNRAERDIYATADRLVASRDAALARIHTRVDDLQTSTVSKADLEPLRADIRQMREQTSGQITSLIADVQKLISVFGHKQ